MSNFVVSARKYRPAAFGEVVGQKSISKTLKTAIKNDHLAHAFLFCGPRGVGKTTTARILAKTINCMNPTDDFEPCNKCESCVAFNNSASFNIHELDAASNNSVEDIRGLIDQVRITPQVGKYSIYIIDEVHMLSNQAFNAFLKTLEEPPKHAIFILATTEKHKIIPTILSRCQIFNFERITIKDIILHLKHVAEQEQIEAEENALHTIAQKADGAMRDALSIFDQIVSSSGKKVTYQDVIENLNILDYEYYFKVTNVLLQGKYSDALLIFDKILNKGFDGQNFIIGLGQHFRDLLVCKDPQTIDLLEVSGDIKLRYNEQSQQSSVAFLYKALSLINQSDINYKSSKNQRLLVELTLMSICNIHLQLDKQVSNQPIQKPEINKTVEHKTHEKPKPKEDTKSIKPKIEQTKNKDNTPPATKVKPKGLTMSISLDTAEEDKNIGYEKNKKEQEISTQNTTNETKEAPLSQLKIEAVWESYINKLTDMGKVSFANTLKLGNPQLTEKNVIKFSINNKTEEHEFKEMQTEFLGFLREQLKNYSVQVQYVIEEADAVVKAFTPEDKFKDMVERNPVIQKLKDQLSLDFEY